MTSIVDSSVNARSSKISSKTHFRFLDLPGEIRNRIYRYCLVEPACLRQSIHLHGPGFQPCLNDLSAGIVRACKQTEEEGLPILMAENTWRVYGLKQFNNEVLRPMRSDHLRGLRTLYLTVKSDEPHLPLQVGMGQEDHVRLHLQLTYFFYCNQPLMSKLEELHVVLYPEGEDFTECQDHISSREIPAHHKDLGLNSRQVKDTLIVQRAVCNLVRMKLLKEHKLSSSLECLLDGSCNTETRCLRRYVVSLKKQLSGQDILSWDAAMEKDRELAVHFPDEKGRNWECKGLEYDHPVDYDNYFQLKWRAERRKR